MDEETRPPNSEVEKDTDATLHEHDTPDTNDLAEANANVSPDDAGPAQAELGVDSESHHGDEEVQAPEPGESSHQEELHTSIEADKVVDMTKEAADITRVSSRASSRKASKRTEVLIQQAARDIIAQVEHDNTNKEEEADDHSMVSERTDHSLQSDDGEQSYVDHSEMDPEGISHISHTFPSVVGDGDDGSSQHEGTDEDVFTDKSPRSSMGSYDASSESGKRIEIDNMTTITRSPRISDISQYDREDFVPTARGTPRPPFRTPSDVRAMQMSSPPASVHGSPRSSRKHFPTVSRLGTPSASAQYSPKRKSTPPRFKSRQEAPLVLLHVTLLPLRWMWGDLVNNLDPAEMSEQAKILRDSWRILQDRVGDTVIERGILLGHPQNDYEVLEERLLEALDLPVRRRARILECGHYLGPSNETTLTEGEESEDEYSQQRRQSASKRHWCATCKNEIRYDSLGEAKVFRVKVYASNGLMRAGAWEACWKEMERVDVELEPVVEPAVQDEIVRLAAAQQEREIAQQEEAEIAKEVALQYEEQRRSEERLLMQQAQAQLHSSPPPPPAPEPEVVPEPVHEPTHESRSSRRRQRDEERLREIYGETPPPPESHPQEASSHHDPESFVPPPASHPRETSSHHHPDSFIPPPSPQSPSEGANERRDNGRRGYQSASLPELLLQSIRVLMQDRKNVVIVTLSVFILMLALRSTPTEPPYKPTIHRLKAVPQMQHTPVTEPLVVQEQQRPVEASVMESISVATSSSAAPHNEPSQPSAVSQEASSSYVAPYSESSQPSSDYPEASPSVEEPSVVSAATQVVSQPAQETVTAATTISTVYEPCETVANSSPSVDAQVSPVVSDVPTVQEIETVTEKKIVTEKKVVKVVHTVTETQTQTQTQTEVETATAFETVMVKATEVAQLEFSSDIEEQSLDSPDDAILVENGILENEAVNNEPAAEPVTAPAMESAMESTMEPETEPATEPAMAPVKEPVLEPEEVAVEL
ncbi:hypothetical protein HD806DRAFT_484024 [Xylariaceae sp. AK1471]|nr:hypothetical protein HD806DRAFT_484024 [Xylariaceae sp. AK1471]